MKYVVSWTPRSGGSGVDNETTVRRSLAVFAAWRPPAGQTFHQFLGRLDGRGGFAVVETDDPVGLLDAPAKFGPFFDFEVYPVADIADTVRVAQEGAEFRASIT